MFVKRCLLLSIGKHKSKITVGYEMPLYHFIPMRIFPTKRKRERKKKENKGRQGWGEIIILIHCWWEGRMLQMLQKTLWKCLKNLSIELPYYPQFCSYACAKELK